MKKSLIALFVSYILMFSTSFIYFPNWKMKSIHNFVAWDVTGYYFYLPSLFIYDDVKEIKFADELMEKYYGSFRPHGAWDQKNGTFVNQYSCGMAVQFLPFFTIGHLYAKATDYPPDGFSPPYMFALSFGSLLIAFLGLWYLRKILLMYFSDTVVAITILSLVVGTNYLNYATIAGGLSHNYLFTDYVLLIYATISFYKNPSFLKGGIIGLLVGLMALTRPTEIISCLIPLLWGVGFPLKETLLKRMDFIKSHFPKFLLAAVLCVAVGSLQLIYWKYVTGNWFFYSYRDQGFSWLSPHINEALFHARAGWITYTPIIVFALIGFIPLYRKRFEGLFASLVFFVPFAYIVFAWDIWWYGGSLGHRAMIQSYPILAFSMCAFYQMVGKTKRFKWALVPVIMLFFYYNIWLTHQAHSGGLLHPGSMTEAYLKKILFTYKKNPNDLKLLDTNEEFTKEPQNVRVLSKFDFDQDSTLSRCPMSDGMLSLCLSKAEPRGPAFKLDNKYPEADWVRASATFFTYKKEWNYYGMTQFIVHFKQKDRVVKSRFIRVDRMLNSKQRKRLFIDVKFPKEEVDTIEISFWNAAAENEMHVDDLVIEVFDE